MNPLLVHEWMRTKVVTVNPELRVERAWKLMERQQIRHLPVVQHGQLVGMVTERDLKRAVFGTSPRMTVWKAGKPQPTGTPGDLPVQAIMTQGAFTANPADTLLNRVAHSPAPHYYQTTSGQARSRLISAITAPQTPC